MGTNSTSGEARDRHRDRIRSFAVKRCPHRYAVAGSPDSARPCDGGNYGSGRTRPQQKKVEIRGENFKVVVDDLHACWVDDQTLSGLSSYPVGSGAENSRIREVRLFGNLGSLFIS